MSPERDHDDERPRRSWREIDQMRDRPRERSQERRPRGAAAEARARTATDQYLKKMGKELFGKESGGAEAADLARGVRDAHGGAGLAEACRAYLEALGPPTDPSLLSLFLDAGEREVLLSALEALESLRAAGTLAATSGIRTQLRILAEDPDDDVAYASEELLAKL
jgi:hypothetical protein